MRSVMVMGCDPHLDTVTAAVIDANGGEVELVTVPNTEPGWDRLMGVCDTHGVSTVGIEGASGYGRRLAQTLQAAGVEVREMPTRLTATTRRVDGAGKTDPGDARTIGRAVIRGEGAVWADTPDLEVIRVLSNRRDLLVSQQTADINQLRALLAEVEPETAAHLPRLRSKKQFQALTTIEIGGDPHRETVTRLIREIATDCLTRSEQIKTLERELDENMPQAGKTLIAEIQGAGTITTAQLLAEIAGTGGFATDAKMAAWAGTAPLDASSGRQQRHRLNRGGNRHANHAIHVIVISQLQQGGEAADYINRRIQEGKTQREAIRAAKRYLTRRIWKHLHSHELT